MGNVSFTGYLWPPASVSMASRVWCKKKHVSSLFLTTYIFIAHSACFYSVFAYVRLLRPHGFRRVLRPFCTDETYLTGGVKRALPDHRSGRPWLQRFRFVFALSVDCFFKAPRSKGRAELVDLCLPESGKAIDKQEKRKCEGFQRTEVYSRAVWRDMGNRSERDNKSAPSRRARSSRGTSRTSRCG